MQQTLTRPTGILPWMAREATKSFPAPAQTPSFSVSHINGCVVIGPARTDIAELHPQPLSSREAEVLALVAEGNGNKEIAVSLNISERTVKNHLTGIMTKLRASDRTHAVVTAIRLGWLAI